jgi:hypothetical protein
MSKKNHILEILSDGLTHTTDLVSLGFSDDFRCKNCGF